MQRASDPPAWSFPGTGQPGPPGARDRTIRGAPRCPWLTSIVPHRHPDPAHHHAGEFVPRACRACTWGLWPGLTPRMSPFHPPHAAGWHAGAVREGIATLFSVDHPFLGPLCSSCLEALVPGHDGHNVLQVRPAAGVRLPCAALTRALTGRGLGLGGWAGRCMLWAVTGGQQTTPEWDIVQTSLVS